VLNLESMSVKCQFCAVLELFEIQPTSILAQLIWTFRDYHNVETARSACWLDLRVWLRKPKMVDAIHRCGELWYSRDGEYLSR
jgi:hypothetical protein